MNADRFFSGDAIILKYVTTGEINRQFTFISPLYGIQTATAFGAERLKSRFCPSVQNFTQAELFLNRNPKTGLLKLDDISNVETNDFIKTDIEFIYLVSFFSDILLNTYLSGEEFKNFYLLLKYSMEMLKTDKNIRQCFLFFTCKYLILSGYGLNLGGCKRCGKYSGNYSFDFRYHSVLCEKCSTNKSYSISQTSLSLWKYYYETKYKDLDCIKIEMKDFMQIAYITLDILNNIFNRDLKTFNLIRNNICNHR